MIRDEFNRLMKLFGEAASGKITNLQEVFREVFAFFETLSTQLKTGSEEDKKEAISMMTQMYQQMVKHTKEICQRTGMSEEQLSAFAENPGNFSPEQWAAMQEVRNKMFATGQDLAKMMHPEGGGAQAPKPKLKHKKEDEGAPQKRSKKSKWMRS